MIQNARFPGCLSCTRPKELVDLWGFGDAESLKRTGTSRIIFTNGLVDGWSHFFPGGTSSQPRCFYRNVGKIKRNVLSCGFSQSASTLYMISRAMPTSIFAYTILFALKRGWLRFVRLWPKSIFWIQIIFEDGRSPDSRRQHYSYH